MRKFNAEKWSHYLSFENNHFVRNTFMFDILILFFHALYFHYFCHTSYCLSYYEGNNENPLTAKDEAKRNEDKNNNEKLNTQELNYFKAESKEELENQDKENNNSDSDEEIIRKSHIEIPYVSIEDDEHKGELAIGLYKIIRSGLFMNSHMFCLFILIISTTIFGDIINLIYLCFGVIFVQLDLFSNIDAKDWKLPYYLKYFLKPYVFLDMIAQFVFQIPGLYRNELKYIGIYYQDHYSNYIAIKVLIFILIIYQDEIYSSDLYKKTLKKDREDLIYLV